MDYTTISEVLVFSQGGQQCFDVNIMDDNAVEGNERFIVTASVQDFTGVPMASAVVSIVDDPSGIDSDTLCVTIIVPSHIRLL